jgi:hypothetical protein
LHQIKFDYAHAPTIRDFALSDTRIRGLMGPFGSGKSSGCVVEIIRRAHQQEPNAEGIRKTRWAVVRNTYAQLNDTTIKTFMDWIPEKIFGKYRSSEHTYEITGFPGCHIEILFRALDRPDQVANLLSLELTGAWVNEAREVPWPIVDALDGRIGRYPARKDGGCTWRGIILDTNPPENDSQWYVHFEEMCATDPAMAKKYAIFKQPSGLAKNAENIPNLPEGYYIDLAVGKDSEWRKVYVDGNYGFVQDGKAVYPQYNDNVHCQEVEPVQGVPIHRGWDFGLTPACILTQVLPSGQWIAFDEARATNAAMMGIDRFSDDVLSMCSQNYSGFTFIDTGDPAGNQRSQTKEDTCFQILRSKGVTILEGKQDLTIRLESVRHPLNRLLDGKPGFAVSPRCKMLRKGFQGAYKLRRMQVSGERYANEPEKNEASHIHDALQYSATRIFGQIIRTGNVQPNTKPLISMPSRAFT